MLQESWLSISASLIDTDKWVHLSHKKNASAYRTLAAPFPTPPLQGQ